MPDQTSPTTITAADILAAYPTVAPHVRHTPLYTSQSVAMAAGMPPDDLFLKMGNPFIIPAYLADSFSRHALTLTESRSNMVVV